MAFVEAGGRQGVRERLLVAQKERTHVRALADRLAAVTSVELRNIASVRDLHRIGA